MCNFVYSIRVKQDMIALFNKGEKTCTVGTRTAIAELIGRHQATIRRHLPYWETGEFIICQAEIIRTRRGK